MVPRRGLEPPRIAPLVPETSASTSSATWARWVRFTRGAGMYALARGLSMNGRPNGRGRPATPAVSGVLWLSPAMSDHNQRVGDMAPLAARCPEH